MHRRDFLTVSSATAAGAVLPWRAALANDVANMGILASTQLVIDSPPWRGSYQESFFVLENKDGFGNCFFRMTKTEQAAKRVSVDVFPVGTAAHSGAGLAFNGDAATGDCLAVTLQPSGTLGISSSTQADGIFRITELPALGLRSDVVTRLSLENADQGINILTNGEVSGHFSDRKLKGTSGILAIDLGSFYFANFTLA